MFRADDLLGWAEIKPVEDWTTQVNQLLPSLKGLTIISWLAWMVVMFNFSSPKWGGTQTQGLIEQTLAWSFPAVLDGLSASHLDLINFLVRKAAHVTEYAILTVLGYLAWSVGFQQSDARSLQISLGCSVLFAIADEFHQSFSPGRSPQAKDVLLDTLGAMIAIALILWFRTREQTRVKH